MAGEVAKWVSASDLARIGGISGGMSAARKWCLYASCRPPYKHFFMCLKTSAAPAHWTAHIPKFDPVLQRVDPACPGPV
jgi:hypothetical protein